MGLRFSQNFRILEFWPDAMVNTDNFSPAGIDVNRGSLSRNMGRYISREGAPLDRD